MTEAKKNALSAYHVSQVNIASGGESELAKLEREEEQELLAKIRKNKLKAKALESDREAKGLAPTINMMPTQVGGQTVYQPVQDVMTNILKDPATMERWNAMTQEQKQDFIMYANMAAGQNRPESMLQTILFQQLINKSSGQQMSVKDIFDLALGLVKTVMEASKTSAGAQDMWKNAMETLSPLITRLGQAEQEALVNKIQAMVGTNNPLTMMKEMRDAGWIKLPSETAMPPEAQLQLENMRWQQRKELINIKREEMKERAERESKDSEKEWLVDLLKPIVREVAPMAKSFMQSAGGRVGQWTAAGNMPPQQQVIQQMPVQQMPMNTPFPCQNCHQTFAVPEPPPDVIVCPFCQTPHPNALAKNPVGTGPTMVNAAAPPSMNPLEDKWMGRGATSQ